MRNQMVGKILNKICLQTLIFRQHQNCAIDLCSRYVLLVISQTQQLLLSVWGFFTWRRFSLPDFHFSFQFDLLFVKMCN